MNSHALFLAPYMSYPPKLDKREGLFLELRLIAVKHFCCIYSLAKVIPAVAAASELMMGLHVRKPGSINFIVIFKFIFIYFNFIILFYLHFYLFLFKLISVGLGSFFTF